MLKLRADVFVMEQACVFADIDGRDPDALHLLARAAEGGPFAGTLRLFPADAATGHAAIGRVATSKAARGTGLGRALMVEGMAQARRRFGPVPIAIGAQARLERFYGSLGFVRTGDDDIEDGIAHCAMAAR